LNEENKNNQNLNTESEDRSDTVGEKRFDIEEPEVEPEVEDAIDNNNPEIFVNSVQI